jgi:hypothetical protein
MTRKSSFKTWPRWTTTQRDRDDRPIGEVGMLEDVMMSDLIDDRVFVFTQSRLPIHGFYELDDRPFCHEIYALLKSIALRPGHHGHGNA